MEKAIKPLQLQKEKYYHYFFIALFFILPWIIFGLGYDLTQIVLAPGDASIAGYPVRTALQDYSFWSPYNVGGVYSAMKGSTHAVYLPALLIMNALPEVLGYNTLLLVHYSLAGLFTYLFLNTLGIDRISSFFGGIVFMFSGFLSAHLGHINMICAAIYLPAVLLAIELYIQKKHFGWLVLGAFFFMMSIAADYWAMPFYIGMVGLPYLIYRVITEGKKSKEKAGKIIWNCAKIFLVIYIGGLLLAAFYCLPIFQALSRVTRSTLTYEAFASFGFPAYMIPILIFPFAFNQNMCSVDFYGPWNLTELAGYMPVFALIFAVVAFLLLRKKKSQIWFWSILAVIAFVLVLGDNTPFYKLAFHIPGYNMFRAPARNWYEVNFALSILFAFGLSSFIKAEEEKRKKILRVAGKIAMIVAVIAVIIIIVLVSLKPFMEQLVGSSAHSDRFIYSAGDIAQFFIQNMNIGNPSFYIPLIMIGACIVWIACARKFGWTKVTAGCFSVILLFNIFYYAHWIPGTYFPLPEETPVLSYIENEGGNTEEYRLYPMDNQPGISPMGNILNHLNVINTYSTMQEKNYAYLTGFYNPTATDPEALVDKVSLISALGVKYLIAGNRENKYYLEEASLYSDGEQLLPENIQWYILSGTQTGETCSIESGQGNYSLMQTKIALQPETYYRVSFLMKAVTPAEVFVDMFSEDGNLNGTQRNMTVKAGDEYNPYSFTWYSGDSAKDALLRFGVNGLGKIEVKDVSLVEIEKSSAAYEKVFEDEDGNAVYYNPQWIDRVHFAEELIPVKSIEEIDSYYMVENNFDPQTQALVEGITQTEEVAGGMVLQQDYSNNDAPSFIVQTDGEKAFFVMSDNVYPGWQAYVDGEQVDIYTTNGTMRGVFIEGKGEHEITFRFIPKAFYAGLFVSVITAGCFVVVILIYHRKQRSIGK